MASHFGYTEEYVLSHTPEWLMRKSRQAAQEKIDAHHMRIVEGFKGLALFIDMAFNQGRKVEQILPPFQKKEMNSGPSDSPFMETIWWKSE